jgi:hypothetical protein
MADTYEINDPSEEQVTLEEQAETITDTPDEGRPEWLPEKFKSPADLAEAYNNLESKLGSSTDTGETEDLPPTEAPDEIAPSQNEAIQSASSEWQESGELSDATYDSLAQAGLGRELVDSYIEGQNALQTTEEDALMNTAGGRDAYGKMSEWASEELSEKQLDAFNSAIETGSKDQATLAIDWLKSKYETANGTNPALILGRTQGSSSNPFESRAQILAAMSERDVNGKKKYENDPAFRQEVERRLAISNI